MPQNEQLNSQPKIPEYPISPIEQKSKNIWLIIVVVVFTVIIIGGGVWWRIGRDVTEEPINEEIVEEVIEEVIDETADWQTYRNDEYGFEVRYPNAFQKKENNQTNKLFSATDGHFWIFIDDNNQYLDAIKIKDNNKDDLGYPYQESFVLIGGINSLKQGRYDLGVIEKYYIPKGNKIFRIEFEFNFDYPDQILEEDKKELINQILPTFKFTK